MRVKVMADDPLIRAALQTGLNAVGLEIDTQAPELLIWDLGPALVRGDLPYPMSDLPILALVVEARDAKTVMERGACGVLYRDGEMARIAAAAQAIGHGLQVIDRPFREALLPRPVRRATRSTPLSAREAQVLELLTAGRSNKEIASALDISEHTAKFHVNAIMEKMGAQTRTDAVVRAVRNGWVSV